jgi:hypothetical protein
MRGRCQGRHRVYEAATLSTRLEYDAKADTVSAGLSGDTCASQHLDRRRGWNERPRFSSVFSRSPFLSPTVDPRTRVENSALVGYPRFAALALPDSR